MSDREVSLAQTATAAARPSPPAPAPIRQFFLIRRMYRRNLHIRAADKMIQRVQHGPGHPTVPAVKRPRNVRDLQVTDQTGGEKPPCRRIRQLMAGFTGDMVRELLLRLVTLCTRK